MEILFLVGLLAAAGGIIWWIFVPKKSKVTVQKKKKQETPTKKIKLPEEQKRPLTSITEVAKKMSE